MLAMLAGHSCMLQLGQPVPGPSPGHCRCAFRTTPWALRALLLVVGKARLCLRVLLFAGVFWLRSQRRMLSTAATFSTLRTPATTVSTASATFSSVASVASAEPVASAAKVATPATVGAAPAGIAASTTCLPTPADPQYAPIVSAASISTSCSLCLVHVEHTFMDRRTCSH